MPERTPVDLEIQIESYGFECETGPLTNCLEWIELKARIYAMNEALESIYLTLNQPGIPNRKFEDAIQVIAGNAINRK